MRSKSILLKSIICGSVYFVLSLLIIVVVYIMDFFQGALILGIICGISIAVITCCDTVKRTVIARCMGILAAAISQMILFISGIPYDILLYYYRNDTWVMESGRLSVNEVIGYNLGCMTLWYGLIISFIISIVSIFVFNIIKKYIPIGYLIRRINP